MSTHDNTGSESEVSCSELPSVGSRARPRMRDLGFQPEFSLPLTLAFRVSVCRST